MKNVLSSLKRKTPFEKERKVMDREIALDKERRKTILLYRESNVQQLPF
jgi:hypothetical protein